MKKLLLSALTLCSLTASIATAEQTGANPQFGLLGGGQFGNDEMESGGAALGTVGIRFTPHFALDLQGGWMPTKSKEEEIADADLTITSFEIVPRIYAPMGRFQPYIGAGAGYFFIDEELDVPDNVSSLISQDVENRWAGIFTGGFDFAISENMALGFEVSYIHLRSHVETTLLPSTPFATTSSESVNLDIIRALAGIRIKFNAPGWSNVYQ